MGSESHTMGRSAQQNNARCGWRRLLLPRAMLPARCWLLPALLWSACHSQRSPHGNVLLEAGAEGSAADLPHLLAVSRQHLQQGAADAQVMEKWLMPVTAVGNQPWAWAT
jgi:hypothetical protein